MAGGRRHRGSSPCHLRVILAYLGVILAPSWLILASSWRHFGSSWLILAHLGVILAYLGSSWRILAHLGKSWRHLGSPCRHLGVQRALGGVISEPQFDPDKSSKSSSRAGESLIFMFCENAREKKCEKRYVNKCSLK